MEVLTWHDLSNEMAAKILLSTPPDSTQTVVRFVCRQWRDLVPHQQGRPGRFVYALAKNEEWGVLAWAMSVGCHP